MTMQQNQKVPSLNSRDTDKRNEEQNTERKLMQVICITLLSAPENTAWRAAPHSTAPYRSPWTKVHASDRCRGASSIYMRDVANQGHIGFPGQGPVNTINQYTNVI